MTVFVFGGCLAAALALCSAVCLLCAQRNLRAHVCRALVMALPTALVCSRIVWCAVNYNRYILYSPAEIFSLTEGGFSLWGGLFAAAAVMVIYARMQKLPAAPLLDAFAPGAALFIAFERMAEAYTGQGIGREVTLSALENTPLSILDPYWQDCYRFAVYRYEAALALIVFIALIVPAVRKRGGAFVTGMSALCAFQLVFEMLRDDDYMFIYYFRISQILCAVMLLVILLSQIIPLYRKGRKKAAVILFIVFAAGAAMVVRQDFAVDNVAHLELSYLLMLCAAAVALAPVHIAAAMNGKTGCRVYAVDGIKLNKGWIIAAAVVLAVCCAFCALLIPSGGWASSIP